MPAVPEGPHEIIFGADECITAGHRTSTTGTWTQGETVVVQLDRPLLFEGDRVRVELIDRETNSLVMDRTVRIENTERFQFTPPWSRRVA